MSMNVKTAKIIISDNAYEIIVNDDKSVKLLLPKECISKSDLIRQTRNGMMNNHDSYMWDLCEGDLDLADITTAISAVKERDNTAQKIICNYLDNVCGNIVYLNDEMGYSSFFINELWDNFNEQLKNHMKEYCLINEKKFNAEINAMNLMKGRG